MQEVRLNKNEDIRYVFIISDRPYSFRKTVEVQFLGPEKFANLSHAN